MSNIEIVSLLVSILGIGCFATLFTILYMTFSNSTINEYKSGKRDIELIDEAIHDNLLKTKKRNKIMKTIKSIGIYGFMIIIIPFFIISLIDKFSGDVTMINNKGLVVIATGSMSEKNPKNQYIVENDLNNQFDAYSIIVIEKFENEEEIMLYDVISFINDKGINVIHRIIKIETVDGITRYETRGDSNNASDKYHPKFEDIQGRYINENIPNIGIFVLFMQSYIGIITIISLIYCLFMIDKFTEKILNAQNERLEILKEVIDYKVAIERDDINVQFYETIYYKGYEYKFNENGFIDKKEMNNDSLKEESDSTIIRIINNNDDEEIIKKRINNLEEEGKEVK